MTTMADNVSPLDEILEMREQIGARVEPKLFPLPGYGEALQAKYRTLDRDERKENMRRVLSLAQQGEKRAAEKGYCMTLAKACVGIFTLEDGEPVPVNVAWDLGDDPVKWGDKRLASKLGMKVGSKPPRAREVIEFVFNDDDDALEEHHDDVARWIESTKVAGSSDF